MTLADLTGRQDPSRSIALAVDLGGTKVEAALVTAEGVVVEGSAHRAPTGPEAGRRALEDAVDRVVLASVAHLPDGSALVGVGIGSAGPVDLGRGTVSPKNLPRLHGFDLRTHVARLLPDAPVVVRLDGTCIALAEHWLGATRGTENSMAMIVSTGIGGGVILHGRLIAGRSGNAGHIGQVQIASRVPGESADDATLERIASGPRSVAWARARGWDGHTGEALAVDAAAGDPVARSAVVRSATAVGQAIASAATFLDLEAVAVGGGFTAVSTDYLDLVRAAVQDAIVLDYAAGVVVTGSALDGAGPILGAAALIHRPEALGLPPLDPMHHPRRRSLAR